MFPKSNLGFDLGFDDRVFRRIFIVAALLGLIYNAAILIGFGPDEPRHMAYVGLLWDEHRLPFQTPDGPDPDPWPDEYRGAHSFHPPLYYLFLLPFYAVGKILPANWLWHFVRLGSWLLCLASLPLIYAVARRAGGISVARLATLGVGWTPMWGMTAATINNDAATLFAVSFFLWLLVERCADAQNLKSAALLGLTAGLGALCKATALLCGGASFVLALLFQGGRTAWKSKNAWTRLFSFSAMVVLVAGWWHFRSFQLYGQWTPLPPSALWFSPPLGKIETLLHPDFPRLFAICNWAIFYTLWAQRDWLFQQVAPATSQPPPLQSAQLLIYLLLAAWCLAALFGYARARKAKEAKAFDLQQRLAIGCPSIAFALTWLTVLQVALFMHQGWAEGGRYLLPILSGLLIFIARGWHYLVGPRLKAISAGFGVFLLFLNAGSIYWLISYLNPMFGPK